MEITCPNVKCAEAFEWMPPVDQCPYCGTHIKKPAIPRLHFVQYHKTDEYGPPGSRAGTFGIDTNKSVDGLHGCTVWLISGEGSPKKYFLDCYFVVDKTGDYAEGNDFKRWAHGKRGRKVRPRIPLGKYTWFQELRTRLGDFAAGLSEIGPKTIGEFERLVAALDAG